MKKLWFMLAMVACFLASCSDGGSDEPSAPTPKPEEVKTEITIDSGIVSNGLSFASSQGEQSVSFSVNANWTLSIASITSGATWCKASATSGSKGSANVKFTVNENTSYDDRIVSVTIKAGTVSKTFTITQKGAEAMLVTTSKYEVAQEGGKIEVEVKANVDYQFAISETAKDWITETKSKSRGLTTYKHSFDIAMNEEAEKREGEITFKSGDKVETVKVYQAGGAIILLTKDEFTVSDAGETITVDIKSNVEYGVQMPDLDWITDEASSRGMSSHTLKYVIAPNEGYDARSAEIVFYDKNSDLKETLKVIQAQKDAIIISKKEYDVKAEGETIEVKLSANVDFEITMPEVDWVTQVESRSLKEYTLYFKVFENTGEESRSSEIMFINKDSQLSEAIIINQIGAVKASYVDGVVTMAKAGTMRSLLGDDFLKITSLKVVGPINGDDVYYLRMMLGANDFDVASRGKLATLDLSEAIVVEGGEWYYNNCYTSNNMIGDYMFYYCGNLQHISLPKNVTSIGNYAFKYCINLNSIAISNCVIRIGKDAFFSCPSLNSVYITDLTAWCNIEFLNNSSNPLCEGKLYLNDKAVTDLVVPDNVTVINDYVFHRCSSLESVNIGEHVTLMGRYAFYGCKNLDSVTIGNGLTSISDYTFSNCESLTSFVVPDNITSIGEKAFYNCDALTSIIIPDNVTSVGGGAFSDCDALTSITIGNGLTSISGSAFGWCDALTSIIIPDNVTSIGGYAFYACKALNSVTIGNGVISIGESAFAWCEALTSIVIPDNVTSIGSEAFMKCNALTSITMGDGLNAIDDMAFKDCKNLTSIMIPDNVTSLGREVFANCDALTSVTVGNGATSIGNATFYDCDALTSIAIGDGITTIPDSLCYSCDKLNEVRIGKGIQSIGILAFYINDAYNIEKFYCYAALPPKFSNKKIYMGKFTPSDWHAGHYRRKYHNCFPFYCCVTHVDDDSDETVRYSKDYKTVIQTLYVPARCSTIYKESDWEGYFSNIVEI